MQQAREAVHHQGRASFGAVRHPLGSKGLYRRPGPINRSEEKCLPHKGIAAGKIIGYNRAEVDTPSEPTVSARRSPVGGVVSTFFTDTTVITELEKNDDFKQ